MHTPPHQPKSNGQVEWMNQCLENTLRCVTEQHPTTWSLWLAWAEYVRNSLVSATTGVSPFMAAFGYQPLLFQHQKEEAVVPSVRPYVRQCQRVWRQLCTAIVSASQQMQVQANRRRRAVPAHKDLTPQRDSRKLAPSYVGPFEMVQVVNPVVVRVRLPASMKVYPTFQVPRIKPVAKSELLLSEYPKAFPALNPGEVLQITVIKRHALVSPCGSVLPAT